MFENDWRHPTMTAAVSSAPPLYPPAIAPAERPLSLARLLYHLVRNPLSVLPPSAYEEPISVLRRSSGTVIWASDPALAEEVLLTRAAEFEKTAVEKRVFAWTLRDGVLTSEGRLWRWQRRSMAPMFRHADILRYVPAMAEAADEQIARWRRAGDGTVREIGEDMTETTFAIIARTMLAGNLPAEAAAIKKATARMLSRISWEMAYGLIGIPRWMPHPASLQLLLLAKQLRRLVGDIIARRQRGGGDADDLLGRLLAARDPDSGEPMDHDRLVNNLLTLLEAGHETTSRGLTWTLFLLARAPEWQERVREEVLAVTGGEPVTAEHLPRLTLTQQVLKESMRLYPPVPVMSRTAMRTGMLGGEEVPAGSMVVVPIWCIHRHRRLWSDPNRFDPTRFTPEREAEFPRGQFMPFGVGPRICLGAAFAMVEATVVLAGLIRAARFEWDGGDEPQPISRITLQPRSGMPLRVRLLNERRAGA
jgi:cytochrome P450